MRRLVLSVMLFASSVAWAGDFEDAMAASAKKDFKTAATKFRTAATQGHPYAQFLLGTLYSDGIGVERNDTEAARWYRAAAEQGVDGAQFNLAKSYQQGTGVLQDYSQAIHWFRAAAAQGFLRAQGNLGAMYGLGQGVAKDLVRAHMWFNIAAANGDASSAKIRDSITKEITQQQLADAQRMARECVSSNYKKCD